MSNTTDEPKYLALRPKARILRTLGEELISSETVAIIELVKNSYDADAERVLIRFTGQLEPGKGAIEVIDNGTGMSLNVIDQAWMEPATYNKHNKKSSSKLGRRVLGEKGIGRFAASRLADELELVTKQVSSSLEIYGVFDWTQFDDEQKYLDEILILIEQRPRKEICRNGAIESLWKSKEQPHGKDLSHGTILRMNGLKKVWSKRDFEELQRGLARLVSPFRKQSEFSIKLELPDNLAEFAQDVSPPKIIKYPHYSVKGSVDATGKFNFTYRVYSEGQTFKESGYFVHEANDAEKLLKIEGEEARKYTKKLLKPDAAEGEMDEDKRQRPECGPFELELRVWDRDELGNVVQQTSSTISDVRRDLDAMAGVNIYRDEFRVLPYGEPRDDWLRLDMRRVQNPTLRLSNNQIVGYVSITADENPKLRDQSNREGLDENQALDDLRQILIEVLSFMEKTRFAVRPRKISEESKRPLGSLFAAFDLAPLREHLAQAHPKDTEMPKIIERAEREIAKQIEEVQTVLARYHSLATLGQLIDVVLHDGRHPVGKIQKESLLGQEEIDKSSRDDVRLFPTLHRRFAEIEIQGEVLKTVFRRIEPFGGRRRGKPSQLYLEKIIRDSVGIFSTEIEKLGIVVTLPNTETLVRLDAAEMQQVFSNLIQNSMFWLQKVEDRRISIAIKRVASDHVEVLFADSGPGVPQENRKYIFEPYFSTKPNGVGLGLAIAGEIISDFYGGKLELLNHGPLPGAVFRISLRKRV
ncbi:C4-dicarboxylate transport sensor protein DctB [Symmachiella dynata]|uniref:histidine kinase n=1 Tax=Symmachiella dynata TaxID=2527995 RepID=A0A517ZYS3_9PLAN|nr:ATP-binding protein [Symmachiella dynata]QDU47593.1 C4-dicarboxylate transport sensor protein DctB [Symmachiella dynata]